MEYQEPLNAREIGNQRAARVLEAWEQRGGPAAGEPLVVTTPAGPVLLGSVELLQDEDGNQYVEVFVGDPEGGDPHFRIFNPPTLVRGPGGALVEDPLAAVAQAIADQGGAQRRTGRKRVR